MEILIYCPDCGEHLPPELCKLPYPITDRIDPAVGCLIWRQGELTFAYQGETLSLDWSKWWYYHYHQRYNLAREPLAKALGIKGNPKMVVWDVTCGLAKDSLLMLAFGANVVAFERNLLVGALLQNALARASSDKYLGRIISERFKFYNCDPVVQLPVVDPPDVIYLDPMYANTNSKAKSTLAMRMFREVIPAEDNLDQLFYWALKQKPKRIVIKRAIHAPLLSPNPKVSYRGKSTRYDMYVVSEVAD